MGYYLDGQSQLMRQRSDIDSPTAGRRRVSDNRGDGFSLRLEGGRRIAINDTWSVTPHAQVS